MPDTTCHMSISLDGFVAGPHQSREHPLGNRGPELHGWHMGDERANEADETATGSTRPDRLNRSVTTSSLTDPSASNAAPGTAIVSAVGTSGTATHETAISVTRYGTIRHHHGCDYGIHILGSGRFMRFDMTFDIRGGDRCPWNLPVTSL